MGREATISEGTITVAGWTGVGYIVSDPETGAGAYRISGGGNGGLLPLLSGIGLGASAAASFMIAGLMGMTLGSLLFLGIMTFIRYYIPSNITITHKGRH